MICSYNKLVPLFLTWFLHLHVYYFTIWQGCFSTATQARALCKTDVCVSDIHFPQVFSGLSQQAWGNGIAVKRLQFRNVPAIDTQVFNRVVSCMETEKPKYSKPDWISEFEQATLTTHLELLSTPTQTAV